MLGHWNGSRKERKGFPAQHPPLRMMPGAWKRTPPCSLQGKKLTLKRGYSKLGMWSRCRPLAVILGECSIHSWRQIFFERAEIPFGQQTERPGFQNRAPYAGSEHAWKKGPVMTVTRSLTRHRYTCSDPVGVAECVKHSCVDASKFLSPSLGRKADSHLGSWLYLFKPHDVQINISTF